MKMIMIMLTVVIEVNKLMKILDACMITQDK